MGIFLNDIDFIYNKISIQRQKTAAKIDSKMIISKDTTAKKTKKIMIADNTLLDYSLANEDSVMPKII